MNVDPNMRLPVAEEEALAWYSPLHAPFQVAGLAWPEEARRYRRLPSRPRVSVPPAVDELAGCPTGGQIRFRTNSAKLSIRVKLRGAANMYHMPATGQCGFDCYLPWDGQWVHHSTTRYDHTRQSYESRLFSLERKEWRSVTLNMPLYQGVEEVWLGIEPGTTVTAPLPYDGRGKVIVYGTSITQGGCASRPGMLYTNILSRRISREFVNLGFSGNGKGEPELAELIGDIADPALLVLDYDGNCPSVGQLQATLPEFIRIYRGKHPLVPILVLSRPRRVMELWDRQMLDERLARTQVQAETVERLRQRGDRHVHFVDGSGLLGEAFTECTVDGGHPTDLGFMRIADSLTPIIRQLLQGEA